MSIKKLVSQIEKNIAVGKELEAKLLEHQNKLSVFLIAWAESKDDAQKHLTRERYNLGTKRKPNMLWRYGIVYYETYRDEATGNAYKIERSQPVYFEESGWDYDMLYSLYNQLKKSKEIRIKST